MPEDVSGRLSRRERQIMEILFELGVASAADVHRRLPDPPSYTAVRTMLRILEDKGFAEHSQEGRRYIYRSRRSPGAEGRSALRRVLQVFFGGSMEQALAAHLDDPRTELDADELARLRLLIERSDRASAAARKKTPKTKPRWRKQP